MKKIFWFLVALFLLTLTISSCKTLPKIPIQNSDSSSNSDTSEGISESSSAQSDTSQPYSEASDNVSETSQPKPTVSNPVVSNPVVSKPSVSEPSVSKPAVSEPTVSKPTVSEPSVSKPAVSEPTVSEPTVSEPTVSEPTVSEPVVSEPDVSEPSETSDTSDIIIDPVTVPINLHFSEEEFANFQGTYVKKTSKVSDDYFSNIYMLGDSLTVGLEMYGNYPPERALAYIGKGVYNILNTKTELGAGSGYKKTIDWLRLIQPEVLYINLGMNGIEELENDVHIRCYNTMLDEIVDVCPNTTIVLVSMSSFSEERGGTAQGNGLNNKIIHFNMSLLEIAKERGMYFVNAAEALIDEKCSLPDKYDAGDGQHWSKAAREAYMEYLYTHPITTR